MSKRKTKKLITSIIFLIAIITGVYFGNIELDENVLDNTTQEVSYN